ncbi:MAG: SCO family protein [Desulfuromonadales bacterium]|nr:SCO family protein [Desulfuromonadales bacterium]
MTKPVFEALRFFAIGCMVVLLAGHAQAAANPYRRMVEHYAPPDVVLVNQNGEKVHFVDLVQSGKPVIVDFIYSACAGVCPALSAGYANLQKKLGPESNNVHLVSISIDPENDTPKVMREFLKRYQAKPGWDFLTGSRDDIDKLMYAFNAYIPNKTYNFPLTLIHSPADGSWIRLFGLLSNDDFYNECKRVGVK